MSIKNYKFPFENIYCVSLEESSKRREHIKDEMTKQKIKKYEFIDAVTKTDQIVENAYSNGQVKLYPPCFRCGKIDCQCDNNVLIPTQVATFFSHKKIWEIIAKQKDGMYLIIEDDIKFNTYYKLMKLYFHKKINTLSNKYINEPLLLRLAWAHNEEHKFSKIKLIENSLKMSNPMYSINPEMAKILLNDFKIVDTTVDVYIHKNIGLKHKNFTLFPPLAYELSWSTGDMESLVRPRSKRIEHLKNNKNEDAQQELKKYEEHIDRAIHKKILAIGHPRTGSGYTSALLKAYGLDVGHEKMGEDGIVSWMFTVYDLNNPFYLNKYAKSRYYAAFDNIIMFARDPFTAVPSIIRENNSAETSYDFRRKHILKETNIDLNTFENDLEKAIENYYLWSKMAIEKNKPSLIIRVEYDDKILFNFLKKQKIEVSKHLEDMPEKNINSNKAYKGKIIDKPLVSDDDWINLNKNLKLKLNELCNLFNYEPMFNNDLTILNR